MREKFSMKRIAVCLLGLLLLTALALGALVFPVRADETPDDGRINESFENVTQIHRFGSWTLPSTDEHTFFLHSAYALHPNTKIADDPAATDGTVNKVLQLGRATENTTAEDMFGTRSFTGFNKAFTVSFDFYFPLHLKNNNYFAPMFFGVGASSDFGSGVDCMPFKLQTKNNKYLNLQSASSAAISFDAVVMPLEQWFTVTVSIDAEKGTGDLYWSTVNPDTGEREYNVVVHDYELNDTWKEGAKKGLGYVRFGSVKMDFQAGKFQVPYYIDNLYVQPTAEPLSVADAFRRTHSTVLSKEEQTLEVGDNKKIDAALSAYDALGDGDKELLASEYAKLNGLNEYYKENISEERIFRVTHAAILAKTADTLLRSDYPALAAAIAAYDELGQEIKDLLAEESGTLNALSVAYGEKYPIAISEDFESFEAGAQLSCAGGGLLDTDADAEIAYRYDTAYSGGFVAQDPSDAGNKAYKISGPSSGSAETSGSCEIVSRLNVWRYNDKFTVKTSFYFPAALREGESLTLTFNSYNKDVENKPDVIDNIKNVYKIEPEFTQIPAGEEGGEPTTAAKNMIRRGDYGSLNKDFFSVELPVGRWFEIIVEADKAAGRLSIYLKDGENVTLIGNSPCGDSQIGSGLAYFSLTTVLAAPANESEAPSAIYVDELYLAPEFYLSEEALGREILAAQAEARGYLNAIQEYLTPGASEAGEDENAGYETLISGFAEAKSRAQLIKLLADFKLKVNGDLLVKAFDDHVAQVKAADSYSEAGTAAIDKIVADVKNADSATSLVCARHGVSMRYTYRLEEGVSAVKEMFESALAAIDAVPTAAEEVTNAKAAAIAGLEAYSADDYRDAEKELLTAAVNKGKEAVNAAETVEAVAAALAEAKAEIDGIKTAAEYEAEEAAAALTAAKENAKAGLGAYRSADDYRETEKELLRKAIDDGRAAIDGATTQDEVASALANAKAAIDGIKTAAEYEAEEAAAEIALREAKLAAKAELAAYKNADDYRKAERAELAAEISAGNDDIDNAETEKAVGVALALAKAKIDLIKTDAQLTAEGVPNEDDETSDSGQSDDSSERSSGPVDAGCGSELFANSYAWITFLFVGACVAGITFASKKRD